MALSRKQLEHLEPRLKEERARSLSLLNESVANATRISTELAEIDAALARLYETPEKFGVSESTGNQIPFDRLDAIPGRGRNGGWSIW